MVADEKRALGLCKKLHELPPVVTDWQQTVWCPDCDHYDGGRCVNPIRIDGNTACPFDDHVLPLRKVSPFDVGPRGAQLSQRRFEALQQAVKLRVIARTCGRMQALAIELTDAELVVRGIAPSYYVKQLALHAALDVLRSVCEVALGLKLDVDVVPLVRPNLGSRMAARGSQNGRS